ncbi:hypothetical protein [Serratia sarumanii]|uniref:hypothetical protein n=1 Tax=Serratia sarumanii TaxID=3020826 RepID=UPI003F7D467A
MEKLSELSKPAAWKLHHHDRYYFEENADVVAIAESMGQAKGDALYSQEYVSALLAELEAKDTPTDIRVAEIEKRLKQRAEEMERILEGITPEMIAGGWTAKGISDYAKSLEAKLATPVRLPNALIPAVHASGEPFMRPEPFGFYLNRDDVIKKLRAAGFTVEGDE